MRLIVADAAGQGILRDKDGSDHELDPDRWMEVDVRDDIYTRDGETAWVDYREDGRRVEIPPNTHYDIEYTNANVIDVRAAMPAVEELIAAMDGFGTDEDRLFAALETVRGNSAAIEQVRALYRHETNRSLDDDLHDELSGDDLERALDLLR